MRKTAILGVLILMSASMAFAGPRILSYQGSLLDNASQPVDGTYDIRFRIFGDPAGGTHIWEEIDAGTQVTDGLFSTILGDGTPMGTSAFASDYSLYLEVAVDLNNNATFEDPGEVYTPRQRIAGSGWAIDSDRLTGLWATDMQRRVTGTAPPGQYITGINADGSVVTAVDQTGGGGGITQINAGPGLAGGGTGPTVDILVTTGGIVNPMLADRSVDEPKLDISGVGSGNSTTWETMNVGYFGSPEGVNEFRALFMMNGFSEGGPGDVRVVTKTMFSDPWDEITSFPVLGGGANPWVIISEPIPIDPASEHYGLQYQADNAASPMFWRYAGFILSENPRLRELEITVSTGSTALQFTNPADIRNVDDIFFHGTGFPNTDLYLNAGDLNDVNRLTFDPDKTFWKNYGFNEFVSHDDDDPDAIVRHYTHSLYIEPAGPGTIAVRTGVHLPQGARVTELRAWIIDNDPNGYIDIELNRYPNGGNVDPSPMAQISTTNAFANAAVQNLVDTTITNPAINNAAYHYTLHVLISGSLGGTAIRFFNARIIYEMGAYAD